MHDDELIDRAAHAMTRGEPSARLRPAIRARIDTETVATRPSEPWLRRKEARRVWIPALASAAALAMLAATLVWTPAPGHPGTSPEPGAASTPPAVVTRVEPPAAESQVTAAPVTARTIRRARTTGTPSRIAVIDPLVIEPISVPLMAVDANPGAMPMDIQPLQIEPLQPQ